MNCKTCGAELREDQMYCPECGQEIHLVSFYNPNDEFLGVDMDVVNPKDNNPTEETTELEEPVENANIKKRINRRLLAIILSLVIVIGIVIIVVCVNIAHKNNYNYQMDKAKACTESLDFGKAKEFAMQASKLNSESVEARWCLINAYVELKDYDAILPVMKEIFEIESYDSEVMSEGIEIFINVKDYANAAKVLDLTTDKKFRNAYKKYIASSPGFSFEEGSYSHDINLEIKTDGKCKIYYSIDEENPKDGTLYKAPVTVKAGEHIVRAVSVNEFGVVSEETKAKFDIDPDKPDMPEINKPSGNISVDETIEISGPDGCKLYYTWDGSEPSAQSTEYTEPIKAPSGNNVLSVVAVDSYGQVSGVAKKNYICIENVEE